MISEKNLGCGGANGRASSDQIREFSHWKRAWHFPQVEEAVADGTIGEKSRFY